MKRILPAAALLTAGLLLLLAGCAAPRTEEHALERLNAYAHAIGYDYEHPETVYAFLTADFRARMSQDAFAEAWEKERSYPYITPLFIYSPEITMDADGRGGEATFLQAARIIGMTYTVRFVYENDDWYICDWDEFLDGSYLEKFEDIPYSIDWYYDFDESENP